MDKQKAIQIAAASALTLAVGGTGLYYGLNYWAGGDFLPSGQARALKANQVLFEGDGSAKDQSDSGSQSDRSAWEKDNSADRQEIPEQGNGSDYLFQSGDNRGTAAGIAGEGGDAPTGNLPDQIFTPDGNGDVIISGGSSGGSTDQKPDGEEKPGVPDYSHVADPAPEKTPSFGDSPYQESNASDDITYYIEPSLWSEYPLYKGQSIDGFALFCQLDTYIMDNTTFSTFYLTKEHYGKYIQVDSVCFTPEKKDDISAWQSDFPLTIPNDCSSFLVKVKYRASLSGAWQTTTVELSPKDCCIYVLKEAPQNSDTAFTVNNILNYGSSSTPSDGETVNLLYYVSLFLGGSDKPLTRLYKGWTENGEYVPWRYTATSGRHILLPGEFTQELDPGLTVTLKNYYLDENLEEAEFGDLSYLQTLTGADAAGKNLQVPYYMQAVLLDGVAADTLTLSDTVSVVTGMGMDIRWAYAVNETNPHFSTVTSGPLARLLLSKDKTRILAVPTSIRELTVPASVTEVAPLGGNSLNKLTLQAKNAQELPALDLESSYNLSEIHVSSYAVMEALFKDTWTYLEANPQVKVTCDEYPGISFEAREGSIIGSDGKLYRVVQENISTITLPNGVTEILPGACLNRPNLKSISLPLDGAPVRLDENSLAGSGLTGLFYQESQKADLLQDLPRSGAPESLVLSLLSVSKEGISYEIAQDGTVTLLRASDDIESFDGTVTAQDGTVLSPNVVGAGCFAECTSLTWVTLPDTVTVVEEYAFRNCSNLQGLMVEATGGLTLGENCLEGCSMLSFVAVNDPTPTLPESLSSSKLSCRCFYPYDGEHVIWGDWTGYRVESYHIADIGDNCRLLYAYEGDVPFMVVASGSRLPSQVALPSSIREIGPNAFADCYSTAGCFTLNWQNLTGLQFIDNSAFAASSLAGDVYLGVPYLSVEVDNYAFSHCDYVTSVHVNDEATLSFSSDSFWYCTALREFHTGQLSQKTGLPTSPFGGCGQLTDLYIPMYEPPRMQLFSGVEGVVFSFTGNEGDPGLHIHVPEGYEEQYLLNWRVTHAGYIDYESMKVAFGCTDTGTNPELEERLLSSEKVLRRLLGMAESKTLTGFYPYILVDGKTVLMGAPKDTVSVYLDAYTMGLSSGELNYIASNAFAALPNLAEVTVPTALDGLYPDAFAGTTDLRLTFTTVSPPELVITPGTPFRFGGEGLTIAVPENMEGNFIDAWRCPMVGCRDEAALRAALAQSYSGEALEAQVKAKLVEGENLVRALIEGLDPVEEPTRAFLFREVDGLTTLVGVPDGIVDLRLDNAGMGQSEDFQLSRIGSHAFESCTTLKSVTVPESFFLSTEKDAFAGTKDLTVTFEGSYPTSLELGNDGTAFSFGGENLKILVPQDALSDYLDSWKYPFAGYGSSIEMNDALLDVFNYNDSSAAIEQALLQGENGVRTVLGLETVSYPTGFYRLREDGNMLTLAQAPKELTDCSLDPWTLGLPDGWYLDYVGANAFSGCTALETVEIPEDLSGIYSGAFSGSADSLTLTFAGEKPLQLIADNGTFAFGVSNLRISVPDDFKDDYIAAWKAQMSGYESMDALKAALKGQHPDWTDTRLEEEAGHTVLENENLLRRAMNLPEVSDPLTHFSYSGANTSLNLDGAPDYISVLRLDSTSLGLSAGQTLRCVNYNAFLGCDQLTKLTLPDTIQSLVYHSFPNDSQDLTLVFEGKEPPVLIPDNKGTPFDFGLTPTAKLTVLVPDEDARQAYIKAWTLHFAGAESEEALLSTLAQQDGTLTEEALNAKAQEKLTAARTALEALIQLPPQENKAPEEQQ